MSSTREIVTDLLNELRQILGEGEVYYYGKTKRTAIGDPTKIFVTNQRIVPYNHKFFGRGTIEDLYYRDFVNTKIKKGMLSVDIELKTRFHETCTIVIQAVNKQMVYDINALITTGIRNAASVVVGVR